MFGVCRPLYSFPGCMCVWEREGSVWGTHQVAEGCGLAGVGQEGAVSGSAAATEGGSVQGGQSSGETPGRPVGGLGGVQRPAVLVCKLWDGHAPVCRGSIEGPRPEKSRAFFFSSPRFQRSRDTANRPKRTRSVPRTRFSAVGGLRSAPYTPHTPHTHHSPYTHRL